jgi:hypothetical protein
MTISLLTQVLHLHYITSPLYLSFNKTAYTCILLVEHTQIRSQNKNKILLQWDNGLKIYEWIPPQEDPPAIATNSKLLWELQKVIKKQL